MEYFFENRDDASLAAAKRIVKNLERRLDGQGEATLVVSGGTSPERCFDELSRTDVDWRHVHVVTSDERWVPPDHDDSNERLVREKLLTANASDASLLAMYRPDVGVEERCIELDDELRRLPFPFACALLGMGEDGHFASLFPDAENLDVGLAVDGTHLCLPVRTAASPHERLSLTLTALSRSDEIVLLMFGEAKRAVYEQAKAAANGMPVARLLKQKRAPVRVFWAP